MKLGANTGIKVTSISWKWRTQGSLIGVFCFPAWGNQGVFTKGGTLGNADNGSNGRVQVTAADTYTAFFGAITRPAGGIVLEKGAGDLFVELLLWQDDPSAVLHLTELVVKGSLPVGSDTTQTGAATPSPSPSPSPG